VLRLGVTTTTLDAAGGVADEAPWEHVTDADLAAAAAALTGEIMQVGAPAAPPPPASLVGAHGRGVLGG
jgi:tRNA U55 pseudouridine synthase TruB